MSGEIEPLLPRVPDHKTVEVRLEYGHFALAQPRNPVGILIDAGDVVTEIRKAGAGHKPDISRANHRNAHEISRVPMPRSTLPLDAPAVPSTACGGSVRGNLTRASLSRARTA